MFSLHHWKRKQKFDLTLDALWSYINIYRERDFQHCGIILWHGTLAWLNLTSSHLGALWLWLWLCVTSLRPMSCETTGGKYGLELKIMASPLCPHHLHWQHQHGTTSLLTTSWNTKTTPQRARLPRKVLPQHSLGLLFFFLPRKCRESTNFNNIQIKIN